MDKKVKVAEIFAGIGGFVSGIFKALGKENVEIVFASEIDKYAAKAYEVLYEHKPHGDITEIDAGDIPDHDILVGGFPCQAFSIAGKRQGFEDTRGTLFFEIARILKQKQPKFAILENVKGLLSHDEGKTVKTILSTLDDLGYNVHHKVLNSKFFNVPQNRERVIFVCIRKDLECTYQFPEQNEVRKKLKDVLESVVDEKFYLSEERLSKFIAKKGAQGYRLSNTEGVNPTLTSQSGGLAGGTGLIQEGYLEKDLSGRRVYSAEGVSNTLDTMQGGNREPKIMIKGELDISDNDRQKRVYETEGIAPTVLARSDSSKIIEVPQWIPDTGGINRTLRVSGRDALTNKHNYNHVFDGFRIRKLTPLECFRLQGFTDEQHQKLVEAGISNSQRYKMAGNAVTTNVIEAVVRNLKDELMK